MRDNTGDILDIAILRIADISITTHDGTINAFLRVIGRSPVLLPTGGVQPL